METSGDAPLSPDLIQVSEDAQTEKALMRLADGFEIETVLMRHQSGRTTVCVSSQAGCAYRCAFCATGQAGFNRHLAPTEIVGQVRFFDQRLASEGRRVTNVVFMGMGEPFHNYDAVVAALRVLTEDGGMAIARRRVTVSTVGLVPEIERFATEGLGVNLAVSLHAPNDALRSRLMPVNERYPLSLLMPILADYERHTGRRVFIEYLMLAGINDRPEHADELAAWLRGTQHHVNLIPYNQVAGVAWAGSLDAQVRGFQARLRAAGVPVTVRHPMGRAILAACGQLQAETQPRGRQPGC